MKIRENTQGLGEVGKCRGYGVILCVGEYELLYFTYCCRMQSGPSLVAHHRGLMNTWANEYHFMV